MSVTIASTTASSIEQAVDDISKQCSGISPTMVLFFASSRYDPTSISRAMYDAFGGRRSSAARLPARSSAIGS
jgi:hypothetical protein